MNVWSKIALWSLCFILVGGMTSCTGGNLEEESEDVDLTDIPIEFEIEVDDPVTRGSLMTVKEFTTYGVYGVTTTAFAKNVIYKKMDGAWTQNKAFSWPKTPAKFYSVNASFDKTTANPPGVMKSVTIGAAAAKKFNYVVPEQASDQFDLMVASAFNKTLENTGGKVKLSFKRVLAYLTFKIVNKLEDNMIVTVGGISLYNLKDAGVFTFDNATISKGTWAEGTTYGAMHRVFDEPFVVPTTSDWLVSQDTIFFSIPQNKTTKWKTTKTNNVPISEADAEHHTYLKLLCKIQDEGGNYIFGSADAYGDVYMPFNLTTATKQATSRLITITFNGGYDENGVPLSFGSDFDILVEDWDETPSDNPIEVEF